MNKKIASEIATGIILLIAIVVSVIFWLQAKKAQAPIVQQAVSQQAVQPEQTATASQAQQPQSSMQAPADKAANQIYTNSEYSFQITLPVDWNGSKVVVNKNNTGAQIVFQLPSTSGLDGIMMINVMRLDAYNKMVSDCIGKIRKTSECYDYNSYLWGKTQNYAIFRIGDEDIPDQMMKYYNEIPQIKESFKAL